MARSVASASFLRELQVALHHLYDPAVLGRSPLVQMLGLQGRDDPAIALRRLLLDSITALKPGRNVAPQSSPWRVYHILSQRYAEQSSPGEVAADLSLSTRQLRRQQGLAVRALADYLWTRHDLEQSQIAPDAAPDPTDLDNMEGDEGAPTREEELAWLQRSFTHETTDTAVLVEAVVRIVAPLLQATGVGLACAAPEGLPEVVVPQAIARQALLNVLTAAIRWVPKGKLELQAQVRERHVCIRIVAELGGTPAEPAPDAIESLEMARRLADLCGSVLTVSRGDGRGPALTAELALPAAEQIAVWVVDDNADALELVQRYLAGTRYRFVGISDPAQVLGTVAGVPPDLIVLDVMLPGLDGWELLGRLREHPRTRDVPIVVSTILPQEQLALALGASAFLRKPLSRRSLLTALDRLLAPPATESS